MSVLVGDAGTGKTTVLSAIEAAHRASGGQPFVPLAPTTRAREALNEAGFAQADTVQRFLVSESMQAHAAGRLVLIDEAGLLSTEQLRHLTRIAEAVRARLLLVGDTKQHYGVQRGDALRNIVRRSDLPVVRLSEVLRQRTEGDRQFSRILASGEAIEAFRYADRRGFVVETSDDESLFAQAAEHYAENSLQGIDTLVVVPFWEEIERFNRHARAALRSRGLLGEIEIVREAVKPLTWTEEQKTHWGQYQVGDRLLFARDTRFFRRGSTAEVTKILPGGLHVSGAKGLCEDHPKTARRLRCRPAPGARGCSRRPAAHSRPGGHSGIREWGLQGGCPCRSGGESDRSNRRENATGRLQSLDVCARADHVSGAG